MGTISLAIHLCELALLAIILWFVCGFIGMSERPLMICRALIVLICVFDAIGSIMGSPVASGLVPLHPLSPEHPSIVR